MKRFFLMLDALLMFAAFDAAALPKTHAKQVTVDPSGILSSTNTNVQAVLEDLDKSISAPATTSVVGVVRFATPEEVNSGTSSTVAVSSADLSKKTSTYGMRYSGAIVHSGIIPAGDTTVDLSGIIGTNRAWVHLRALAGAASIDLYVKTKGEVGIYPEYVHNKGTLQGVAAAGQHFDVSTITDASGRIEIGYLVSQGATNSTLSLMCYQILQ